MSLRAPPSAMAYGSEERDTGDRGNVTAKAVTPGTGCRWLQLGLRNEPPEGPRVAPRPGS